MIRMSVLLKVSKNKTNKQKRNKNTRDLELSEANNKITKCTDPITSKLTKQERYQSGVSTINIRFYKCFFKK